VIIRFIFVSTIVVNALFNVTIYSNLVASPNFYFECFALSYCSLVTNTRIYSSSASSLRPWFSYAGRRVNSRKEVHLFILCIHFELTIDDYVEKGSKAP